MVLGTGVTALSIVCYRVALYRLKKSSHIEGSYSATNLPRPRILYTP